MNANNRIRFAALAAGAALLVSLSAAPAAFARPEPQPPSIPVSVYGPYPALERIGTQFVRGDNLTGAGVSAPEWIPEQGAH
ncbi:hypothetical protein ABZ477_16555 [Microbacterium sp. NPDC019599]|uniref:hypothetical protein n=1 Tax=Microbacterium sp. NPDC019599 TaxID=3154690 RepID=UPI0033F4ADB7